MTERSGLCAVAIGYDMGTFHRDDETGRCVNCGQLSASADRDSAS